MTDLICDKCAGRKIEEPRGYVNHNEWAHKKSQTHNQRVCSDCGLWRVWVLREVKK